MKMRVLASLLAVVLFLWARSAQAATLSVGPGQQYAAIMDAWNAVQPGDTIEVQGGQTYAGTFLLDAGHSGTAAAPITLKGIPVNGQRPILQGIGPGQYDTMVVYLNASYLVMDSFEIIGDGDTTTDDCLVHGADQVTLRDLVVHGCLHQAGLVGDDTGSGSLTLEYSEFYANGDGEYSHQIYMTTDQAMYPGATFRMQFNYIHDGLGGNNVKSRAERNEIDYNWIEGAYYHELDLVGPDTGSSPRRCDSDVVGNVFRKTSSWRVARIGGDGSGDSMGRFRFVNNTMILDSLMSSTITLQATVSTLEMYNNVILAPTAGIAVYDITEGSGPAAVLYGSNNWISTGMTGIPTPWTGTIAGADPGFDAPASYDYRLAASSPLVGAGTTDTAATGSLAFVDPLLLPAFNPPERRLIPVGSAEARTFDGKPAIGAFEASDTAPGTPPPGVGGAPAVMTGNGGSSGDGAGGSGSTGSSNGCTCRVTEEPTGGTEWVAGLAAVGLALARRRR